MLKENKSFFTRVPIYKRNLYVGFFKKTIKHSKNVQKHLSSNAHFYLHTNKGNINATTTQCRQISKPTSISWQLGRYYLGTESEVSSPT